MDGASASFKNEKTPVITVIIATYNSSATLKYAIQSVLNQDLQNFELWVIGDCCTDDSENIVASFTDLRIHWYNRLINSGSQSAPNNDGIERAQGQYIAYLGHDDLWLPQYLSLMTKHLQDHQLDSVHSLCACIGPEGVFSVSGKPSKGRTYLNSHVPPSSWIHKKSIGLLCGPWGHPFKIAAGVDQDYLSRLAEMGNKIACLPHLLVLKFPAASWKLYTKSSNFPQEKMLIEMQEDCSLMRLKLLDQVSVCLAHHYGERRSLKENIRGLIVDAGFSFFNFYSRKRWPLHLILTFYYQSAYKKVREKKGLKNRVTNI